ncbi:hypothetical protein Anapl_14917 [Anas platyrhynchos]|uniref:Uncharacterized protein n=1 Tax=Anas platyrhynchos TaxID=8839 RepID=R0LNG5_ANAPL|nr:hypothetical protein Anapl_14917 [Anas platyrhynchos]
MQFLKLHVETPGKKNAVTLLNPDSPIRTGAGQLGKLTESHEQQLQFPRGLKVLGPSSLFLDLSNDYYPDHHKLEVILFKSDRTAIASLSDSLKQQQVPSEPANYFLQYQLLSLSIKSGMHLKEVFILQCGGSGAQILHITYFTLKKSSNSRQLDIHITQPVLQRQPGNNSRVLLWLLKALLCSESTIHESTTGKTMASVEPTLLQWTILKKIPHLQHLRIPNSSGLSQTSVFKDNSTNLPGKSFAILQRIAKCRKNMTQNNFTINEKRHATITKILPPPLSTTTLKVEEPTWFFMGYALHEDQNSSLTHLFPSPENEVQSR